MNKAPEVLRKVDMALLAAANMIRVKHLSTEKLIADPANSLVVINHYGQLLKNIHDEFSVAVQAIDNLIDASGQECLSPKAGATIRDLQTALHNMGVEAHTAYGRIEHNLNDRGGFFASSTVHGAPADPPWPPTSTETP